MEKQILYKVKPKFNLIYEMSMTKGKKIKKMFITTLFFILFIILLNIFLSSNFLAESFSTEEGLNTIKNANIFLAILASIPFSIFAVRIILEIFEYKHTSYTFYETYVEHKDKFLNQFEKTMEYKDIKEIEIIKTVFDRIMGFGTIIIKTNAENENNNGMILYSIKNPRTTYDIIDEIIHRKINISETLEQELNKEKDNLNIIIEKSQEIDGGIKTNY